MSLFMVDGKSGDSGDENIHRIGSKGLKHYVSSRVMSFTDTEFANKLNAKRTTSTRSAVEFELSDLQSATANFSPGNLLGEGSIGRVYRAKYSDGRVSYLTCLLSNRIITIYYQFSFSLRLWRLRRSIQRCLIRVNQKE